MTRALLVAALALAGCVDATRCHLPSDWKPCAGSSAELGASGTPPAIVALSVPTCAYVDDPEVQGTLHVTDPESDATVVHVTFSQGPRVDESDIDLPDAGRMGTEWSGDLQLRAMNATAMEGTLDVRVKVADLQGNQSVPFCNSLTFLK